MSYSLKGGLSTQPGIVELADFWEIECLRKADSSASILDIVKSKGISDDIQETDSIENDFQLEEEQSNLVEEIKRRINSCKGKYPFQLDDKSWVLSLNSTLDESTWIYTYLLLATRNNMLSNKIVSGIDGTQIFEKLSTDVLSNYLGSNSKSLNFGTAAGSTFYDKLEYLILQLKEGELNLNKTSISYNPQDDKLDVVAWIPFFDTLPSKIICFAQCKTGTHWHGTVKQLNVSDFLKKWFSKHPAVDPLETFIIADILPSENYFNRSVNNLFFDRCRVASFSTSRVGNDWFDDLKKWTEGVMTTFSLSFATV